MLEELPDELMIEIIEFCEVNQYRNIRHVSKRFYTLLDNNYTAGIYFKFLLKNFWFVKHLNLRVIHCARKINVNRNGAYKFIKNIQIKLINKWVGFITKFRIDMMSIILLFLGQLFLTIILFFLMILIGLFVFSAVTIIFFGFYNLIAFILEEQYCYASCSNFFKGS